MNRLDHRAFGLRWDGPLLDEDAARLCRLAAERRRAAARYPLEKTIDLLERVSARWRDPRDRFRRQAQEALPTATGWPAQTVSAGLDIVADVLSRRSLQEEVSSQLMGLPRGGDFPAGGGRALKWEPLGVLLHVLAANTLVGAARSLAHGIITGNVNILKTPSSNDVFLSQLVESIVEEDGGGVVADSLAVVDYPQSAESVRGRFKDKVDAVVVWGGESAVRAYRNDLPARTRLVIFGPKLSLAVVTAAGLRKRGVAETARRLTAEVAAWDQASCASPQVCFVEGMENAHGLAEGLARELEAVERRLPAGAVDVDTAVEIQKIRSVFEVAQAKGEGLLRTSAKGLDWTVTLDGDPTLTPSPLHRTIRLIAYQSLSEIAGGLEPWRGYIQTAGILAGAEERARLCSELSECGALRIAELGAMTKRAPGGPHDGAYPLAQLMQLAVREEVLG